RHLVTTHLRPRTRPHPRDARGDSSSLPAGATSHQLGEMAMNRASVYASVAFAGIALLGASLASATTVQKFSVRELAQKSDAIVMAKVEDQSSRQDPGNKEIYTYITISVTEAIKGAKGEKSITFRQLGGSVGNLISAVPGMPSFKNGEEVVLFLSPKDRAGYAWVMGLQQGKYSIVT